MLQPDSINSTANQSSNSGCVGGVPLRPKSKTVGTSGEPKAVQVSNFMVVIAGTMLVAFVVVLLGTRGRERVRLSGVTLLSIAGFAGIGYGPASLSSGYWNVTGTPGWAASRPHDETSPPRDPKLYADFLRALVARYGAERVFGGGLRVETTLRPGMQARAVAYGKSQPLAWTLLRRPFTRLYRALWW